MKRLTKRQVLLLHEQLLQEFGGTPGVRDEGLLDSALAAPFQTFDGQSLYPSCAGQGGTAWVRAGLQPSLCGWQQADRYPCHAGLSCAEWHRPFLHAAGTHRHDFCGCFQPGERRRPIAMDHPAPELKPGACFGRLLVFYSPIISFTILSHPFTAPTSTSRLNARVPT